jgi:hypothetical protein
MSRSVHRTEVLSVPVCPTVPAYVLTRETSDREVRIAPLFSEIIRPFLLVVLWLIRSCFYLKERFTLEPANMIQLSKYCIYSFMDGNPSIWRYSIILSTSPIMPRKLGPFIPALKERGFLGR